MGRTGRPPQSLQPSSGSAASCGRGVSVLEGGEGGGAPLSHRPRRRRLRNFVPRSLLQQQRRSRAAAAARRARAGCWHQAARKGNGRPASSASVCPGLLSACLCAAPVIESRAWRSALLLVFYNPLALRQELRSSQSCRCRASARLRTFSSVCSRQSLPIISSRFTSSPSFSSLRLGSAPGRGAARSRAPVSLELRPRAVSNQVTPCLALLIAPHEEQGGA